jgi:hypothetical protein
LTIEVPTETGCRCKELRRSLGLSKKKAALRCPRHKDHNVIKKWR